MHHPIYLFRHGETVFNVEKRMQGLLNSPLTETGRAQARAMGLALRRELAIGGCDPATVAVRASPLGRVRETVAIAGEAAGLVHDDGCYDFRLHELGWGDWDGFTNAEIEARFPGVMAARQLDHWNYCPPNGENYVMMTERARPALADIVGLSADRPVAVFAHGGVNRVLRGLFIGASPVDILKMDTPQDAFYRLYKGAAERLIA